MCLVKETETLEPPSLFELVQKSMLSTEGEVEGCRSVVVTLEQEVLNDVCQQVGSLHATAWRVVAEAGKVDVEVVVGGLVVQVDPQLGRWQFVALKDDFLKDNQDLLP